tara:strand:+ start:1082 stop:1603 length:522 start_codon:yes stop_codon:yes gene_type:complete
MLWFINVFLIVCLLTLCIEDGKNREVRLYVLLLLGVFLFSRAMLLNESPINILQFWLINNLVFMVELVFLKMYFSFRNKKVEPLINRYLGLGDVLFISLLGLSFSTYNFVVFLLASLCIALVVSCVLVQYKKIESKNIPLISLLSIPFSVLLILADACAFNLFSDAYLLNLLL